MLADTESSATVELKNKDEFLQLVARWSNVSRRDDLVAAEGMAWNMLAGDAANGIQPLLPIRNPQLLTQLALHMDAVQLRRKVSRLLSSSSPARVVVQGGVVAGDADEFDSYADAGMDIAPADEPRGSSLLASVFGRAKPSDSGTFASQSYLLRYTRSVAS